MNNIEWKKGAVCYADNYQWSVNDDGHLVDVGGSGNLDYIERVIRELDFQLNEPRIGDYLPKSELDTEQKYNDAVEVFGLFGFYADGDYHWFKGECENYEIFCLDSEEVLSGCVSTFSPFSHKLTYNQLMAIGKLKRLMDERDNPEIPESSINWPDNAVAFIKAKECNEAYYPKEFFASMVSHGSNYSEGLKTKGGEFHVYHDCWDVISRKTAPKKAPEVSSDNIKNPNHYQLMEGVESIEIIARSMTQEQWKGFCLGNMLKYRIRAGKKDALQQDIDKANFYGELYEMHKGKCYE